MTEAFLTLWLLSGVIGLPGEGFEITAGALYTTRAACEAARQRPEQICLPKLVANQVLIDTLGRKPCITCEAWEFEPRSREPLAGRNTLLGRAPRALRDPEGPRR
jgi:hypothetical protein